MTIDVNGAGLRVRAFLASGGKGLLPFHPVIFGRIHTKTPPERSGGVFVLNFRAETPLEGYTLHQRRGPPHSGNQVSRRSAG
jgi:hypothetical protein